MGLDFFKRAVEYAERLKRPDQRLAHTIQTNGTRLDGERAAFSRRTTISFVSAWTDKWVENAASETELRKFRQAVDFFRKYGDQYDVPWLLVAAQAYQESQIDQSRKSRVGAVGVMQIIRDEPMDRVNLGLFTMASYNAGPARVAQLRRKAKRWVSIQTSGSGT